MEKLPKVGFVRESHYPTWVVNVVLLKKPNGRWKVCVDFQDLNKACPSDNKLVDAMVGQELLGFMDAYRVLLDSNMS